MRKDMSIVIYTKPLCPFCVRAKALLDKLGLNYQEHDVSRDMAMFQKMMKLSNRRTVPQIFIQDKSIGGYDDLYQLYVNDELDALVKSA